MFRPQRLLQCGDTIETIQGNPIRTVPELIAAVRSTSPPGPLAVTILRNGQRLRLSITTIKGNHGTTMIGIAPKVAPTFNGVVATIGIDPSVIGGPSAGTALALGIIDKLTSRV